MIGYAAHTTSDWVLVAILVASIVFLLFAAWAIFHGVE